MVKGYSIDFLENPYETRKTPKTKLMLAQELLVEKAIYQKNQIVSHLFFKKIAYNSRNQGDLSILHVSTDCSYRTVPARDQSTKADQASMEVQKSLNEWFYTNGYFRRS